MSAPVDRDHFWSSYPAELGELTTSRRAGFAALIDEWDSVQHLDQLDWLAYAMATAWHESAATMQPVRETLATTDAEAFAKVSAYCAQQNIDNYAQRHANGKSYYGRGYVQLTHAGNYQKLGERLGLGNALYDDPDQVMKPAVAAKILLVGMIEGLFRPRAGTLMDYFNSTERDWFNARDLINGDKKKVQKWTLAKWPGGKPSGELIGGYGRAFRAALRTTVT